MLSLVTRCSRDEALFTFVKGIGYECVSHDQNGASGYPANI